MKIAVYPGSFDPITMGHLNIIDRCVKIFDKVIIAVLINPGKQPLFTTEERVELIRETVQHHKNAEVAMFSGLLVNFMKESKASVIVKGLRAISDFDFEFSMALMNRKLNPDVETMFLMTEDRYAFVSSSKIKEIYSLGGRTTGLLTPYVEKALLKKLELTSK